jgi:large conductance mechanosensitive channel
MGFWKDFKDFLEEYKVMGLAIAFIMAVAANTLIQSLVNNIIMPLITPFIPGGAWQTAQAYLGPIVLSWGAFLGAVINFLVVALVIFILVKKIMKVEKK